MSVSTVTRITLKEYVKAGGYAKLSNFGVDRVAAPARDQLKDNQVIIRPLYLSVDPHLRGQMEGDDGGHYIGNYKRGEAISNYLVAKVVASNSGDFNEGDVVMDGSGKWETQYVADASGIAKVPVQDGIDPRDYLGILGVTSFTAYYGFLVKGRPKAGETILVSTAAGGVGQVVVQLAKAQGLRVVGVAGSDEKVEYVKQLGAEAAFNYKTCGDYNQAIKKAAPQGIDMYFDNVGGPFLDAVLLNLNTNARVIGCGVTSQKNAKPEDVYGIKNLFYLLAQEADLVGINVTSHINGPVHKEFVDKMAQLVKEGKIKYKMYEYDGIEKAPQAFIDLYEGRNFGKTIVKV